jgi:hypothetical protein
VLCGRKEVTLSLKILTETHKKIEVLGFDSRRGLGIFLFTTAFGMVLGPTQPPIKWIPGALSLGVKRPGPSAEDKECVELYLHSPNTP